MKTILASTTLLFASLALYAAGSLAQSLSDGPFAAPTSLSIILDSQFASGPTLPPDDYDDETPEPKVASGPTLPPDDYDDETPEPKAV